MSKETTLLTAEFGDTLKLPLMGYEFHSAYTTWLKELVVKLRVEKAELVEALRRFLSDCEYCHGTGDLQRKYLGYDDNTICGPCAAALKLLAKYEAKGESDE